MNWATANIYNMNFAHIESHLNEMLKYLDERSILEDDVVTFQEYKQVYDTLIALKQAQALEKIAHSLDDGKYTAIECLVTLAQK